MKLFAWLSSRETTSYVVSAVLHLVLLAYLAARQRPVFQLPTIYGEEQISAIDATWVEPAPIDTLDELEEVDARVVVTPDRATIDDRDFIPAPSMPEPQIEAEAVAPAAQETDRQAPQPTESQPAPREQPAEPHPTEPDASPNRPERAVGNDPSKPVPQEPQQPEQPEPTDRAKADSDQPDEQPTADSQAMPDRPEEAQAAQPAASQDTKAEATQTHSERPDPRPPKSSASRQAPRRPPPQPASRSQAAGTQTTEPPRVERNPPPLYPATAVEQGWEGVTTLRIHIAADGTVEQVEVLQTSGHAVLDAAAVRAVRKWRFSPALRDGEPVPINVRLKIRFALD